MCEDQGLVIFRKQHFEEDSKVEFKKLWQVITSLMSLKYVSIYLKSLDRAYQEVRVHSHRLSTLSNASLFYIRVM